MDHRTASSLYDYETFLLQRLIGFVHCVQVDAQLISQCANRRQHGSICERASRDTIHNSIANLLIKRYFRIRGFDRPDAILAGIESRTSSPVRIPRDQGMESPVKGIFPCGEGAGYAGGITSAAMDGIKTAEEIIRRYSPLSPS